MVPPLRRFSLDRVRAPHAVRSPHRDEVDREAPEHALRGQTLADLHGLIRDRRRIRRVGREPAAEVALAARPAEELVVRGEKLDLAERRDAQLHARASELLARDPLLDHAALLAERRCVAVKGETGVLEAHRAHPRLDLSATVASSGGGRPLRSTSAFPSPETPSFSLTSTSSMPGLCARISAIAGTTSSIRVSPSRPSGWATPSSAKSRRQPLFVPKWRCRGSAPYIGIPSSRARSRSISVTFRGTRWARSRIDDQAPDLREQARPLEELLGQRSARAVERRDEEQPPPRVRRDHAREQAQVVVDDVRRIACEVT